MDYFIHKNLGGFLRRELDFYIKNEVMRLDDIEHADAPAVESYLSKIKVIRIIAGKLIDFLTQLENFQKKLWLKKKFVIETNYCITLDRVPESLYPEITKNKAQVDEWVNLFAINEITDNSSKKGYTWPLSLDFLKSNDKLVLDTQFFDENFKELLIASIDDFDNKCNGYLFYSENFQALNLIDSRFSQSAKIVYIDPPYNTNASAIPYKNNYRHSSWGTLIHDRVKLLSKLMNEDSAIFVSIDKNERLSLEFALRNVFGEENAVEELIWSQNTNDGRSPTYSTNHEYILVYSKNKNRVEQDIEMFREPKPGYSEVMKLISQFDSKYPPISDVENALSSLYTEHKTSYREEIEAQDLEWEVEKRNDPWKGLYNYKFVEYRDIDGNYVQEDVALSRRSNSYLWVFRESDWTIMSSESKQSSNTRDPNHMNYRYYKIKHPITGKPCNQSTRGWKGTQFIDPEHPDRNSLESLMNDNRIAFGLDEKKVPQQKRFIHEVETNVCKSVFVDYSDGEKETYAMFGKAGVFLAPKHSSFVSRFIQQGGNDESLVIDCFGGSGSTGHSVLDLNRMDKGNRKYILIEMGLHFENVLKPRMIKAIYSSEWYKGKPKNNNYGMSHCFKYQKLESYEDTLNNLITSNNIQINSVNSELKEDYILNYMLDIDTAGSPSLLNIDTFIDPKSYLLNVKTQGTEEYNSRNIDLLGTFNYLIGLRILQINSTRNYTATFKRINDPELPGDQHTKLIVDSDIKLDPEGLWWFRPVTGWVPKNPTEPNNGQRENVLIIWRKLTDDIEQDNLMLNEWFNRYRKTKKDIDFNTIYVNGSSNLANQKSDNDSWIVRLIEEEFMKRMWDVDIV
jgi:adenine-specific DNA-methyltransferase